MNLHDFPLKYWSYKTDGRGHGSPMWQIGPDNGDSICLGHWAGGVGGAVRGPCPG